MAWVDRLRPEIKFTSPSGREFTPLWKGDSIGAEKRLGRHAYPNLDKEVVQDLGMNSRDFPLTVYFDGPDNDKSAAGFEAALYEPGPWQINHPVYGIFRLQLVSYKLDVEPVQSGNVTVFKTEWIDFAEEDEISAVVDPAAAIEVACEAVREATVSDMATVTQKTVSQKKAVENSARLGLVSTASAFRATNAETAAIKNQIIELVSSSRLDTPAIAKGVIGLIGALVALMPGSTVSKVSTLANLGESIMANLPFAATGPKAGSTGVQGQQPGEGAHNAHKGLANMEAQVNSALTGQLFLNAAMASMGEAIASGLVETKREAVTVLKTYRQFASEAQAALDHVAAVASGKWIGQQFVVRANSSEAILTLNVAVMRYLMGTVFSLKIERRITLGKPRAPQEIAIAEYKATAANADYYYGLLCRTNHLHGKELLLLPTGREVVIYA